MERALLVEHLEAARRHADEDEVNIRRQRRIIATLTAMGSDTTEAERVLRSFRQVHENRLADMEQMLNALGQTPPDL